MGFDSFIFFFFFWLPYFVSSISLCMLPLPLNSLLLKKLSHRHLDCPHHLLACSLAPLSREGRKKRLALADGSSGHPFRMLSLAFSLSWPSGTCFSPTKAKNLLLILDYSVVSGQPITEGFKVKKQLVTHVSPIFPQYWAVEGRWTLTETSGQKILWNLVSQWFSAGPVLPSLAPNPREMLAMSRDSGDPRIGDACCWHLVGRCQG